MKHFLCILYSTRKKTFFPLFDLYIHYFTSPSLFFLLLLHRFLGLSIMIIPPTVFLAFHPSSNFFLVSTPFWPLLTNKLAQTLICSHLMLPLMFAHMLILTNTHAHNTHTPTHALTHAHMHTHTHTRSFLLDLKLDLHFQHHLPSDFDAWPFF